MLTMIQINHKTSYFMESIKRSSFSIARFSFKSVILVAGSFAILCLFQKCNTLPTAAENGKPKALDVFNFSITDLQEKQDLWMIGDQSGTIISARTDRSEIQVIIYELKQKRAVEAKAESRQVSKTSKILNSTIILILILVVSWFAIQLYVRFRSKRRF